MMATANCCDNAGSCQDVSDASVQETDFVDELPAVDKVATFKKTHKRDESRISKISRLSIKSLKGFDGVDGMSDSGHEKSKYPFIAFLFSKCFGSWCSSFSFRRLLPPLWGFNNRLEFLSNAKYDNRLLVIGNKFSEHLYQRLNIDLTNKQVLFGNRKKKPKSNRYRTAKYSVWSFIPLNIFEQFRRIANMYFVVTLVMTYVVPNSPVDGTSWLMSLLFVLIVTMLKQAYEDYLRHQNDKEVNKRTVRIVRNGQTESINAELIQVGDIIYLTKDENVPCDAVVLATSDQAKCYVMTANLDGETSLKTKEAATMTKESNDHARIDHIVSCIECENPSPKLDQFLGRMYRFGSDNQVENCSLGANNIILNGSQIKNTEKVWAVAVYTGKESKMALNTKITNNKFSSIEKSLNHLLLFLCGLLILEVGISTVLTLTFGIEYIGSRTIDTDSILWFPLRGGKGPIITFKSNQKTNYSLLSKSLSAISDILPWYIGKSLNTTAEQGVIMAITWLILYNYIIPISLYVSLEVQKFLSNKFVGWDLKLYDEERDIPAKSNTSDVNEELGLITHLFTDKTGTLTQNVMTFKKFCGPDGVLKGAESLSQELWSPLLAAMTLCHSVVVTCDGKLAASSPDELALLEQCQRAGYSFLGEEADGMVSVQLPANHSGDRILRFKKLAELPFDSTRKCMSVIIRQTTESGTEQIHVLTKGAESAICPVSVQGPVEQTRQAVDNFASEGLRTLVFAHKEISKEEFDTFAEHLAVAKFSIVNRFKIVRETYMSLESGLTLLGATGIEDKLQDEVELTISKLKAAGIVVWMLTGDKKETAVNLAHASGLLASHCRAYDLCQVKDRESLVALVNQIQDECNANIDGGFTESSLIVDGKTVTAILKSASIKEKFSFVSSRCRTVVACRLAPVQKSQLVRMIKEASNKNVTAAIGDGGNDISMIQEAHVGLGIYGREGHAAAQAADFSVSQFKHLQRLFLVHGHWYYNRLAFLVQYSFYKQIACFTCQLMFAAYSNFSGTSLFESMFLFLYNTIYTSVPVVVYGLSEQTFPEGVLIKYPELYKLNRGNQEMKWYRMIIWLLIGFWHAGVVFFVWLFAWPSIDIYGNGLYTMGGVVAGTAVAVANLKICVEARYWSWALMLSITWSIISYVIGTLIYDQWLIVNVVADNSDQLQTYTSMFRPDNILFHFLVNLLIITLALLPDALLVVYRNHRRLLYLKDTVINDR